MFDRLVHYLIDARLLQGILHLDQIIIRSVPSSPNKSSSVAAASDTSNEPVIPTVVHPYSSRLPVVDPTSDSSMSPGLQLEVF